MANSMLLWLRLQRVAVPAVWKAGRATMTELQTLRWLGRDARWNLKDWDV